MEEAAKQAEAVPTFHNSWNLDEREQKLCRVVRCFRRGIMNSFKPIIFLKHSEVGR